MTLHLGEIFYLEQFSERATKARLHQISCHAAADELNGAEGVLCYHKLEAFSSKLLKISTSKQYILG